MVNNSNANDEIEKSTVSRSCSSSDDNGNINLLIGCESNDDINAENQIKSYVRRRKCNENVQICEKKKKRESCRKVKLEKVFEIKILFALLLFTRKKSKHFQ